MYIYGISTKYFSLLDIPYKCIHLSRSLSSTGKIPKLLGRML